MGWFGWRLKVVGLIGAAALIYVGVQEARLASSASSEPREISCEDLASGGAGDNAHVRLRDFVACTTAYVYEEDESTKKWSKAYVPAVPLNGEWHQRVLAALEKSDGLPSDLRGPDPDEVHVILFFKEPGHEDAVYEQCERDTLDGMVINEIDSLGHEEKRILRSSYPGVDFDDCWIIEVGRRPAGFGKMAGFIGGGLVLLLGTGAWIVAGVRRGPESKGPRPVAATRPQAETEPKPKEDDLGGKPISIEDDDQNVYRQS